MTATIAVAVAAVEDSSSNNNYTSNDPTATTTVNSAFLNHITTHNIDTPHYQYHNNYQNDNLDHISGTLNIIKGNILW